MKTRELTNKHDECFCETCGHKKASECIELGCKCCVEADKIRLEHPVFEEEQGEEDKTSDEKYREGRRDAWMSDLGSTLPSS